MTKQKLYLRGGTNTLVLGYLSPPEQNGVSLAVLEVSGNDDRVVEIDVPGRPGMPLKLQIRNE